MAIMYPEDIENYKYTGSEKELYDQLKTQLPDKCHVFYSVRWFETREGKRVDSECDFLIFDPAFGFLTVEVKGGLGIEFNAVTGEWILKERIDGAESYRKLGCSPYVQSEKSMRHFYDYFRNEFMQSFRGVYGFCVCFPFYQADELISDSCPKEITIDKNDMGNLKEKINAIFHYWRNRRNLSIPFSAEQRERFKWLVNKRISLSAAAGALIEIKQSQFEKINIIQDSLIDALYNYNDLQFVGGAGTGKTFIAVKKAIRDYNKGKKVLVTCISESLASYIKTQLLSEYPEIKCAPFNKVMEELLPLHDLQKVINGECNYIDVFPDIEDSIKYDSLIIDEAQDFNEDMGLCISALLKPEHKTFYVFYDENQNLYSRSFGRAFEFPNPPIVLKYNIRNTGRIYDYAMQETGLGRDTVANQLIGVRPDISNFTSEKQALLKLEGIINKLINKEYVTTDSIAVLSNVAYGRSILKNTNELASFQINSSQEIETINDGNIHFFEVINFKGIESSIVIYLNHRFNEEEDQECMKYVALTRARYFLYIININK